MGVFHSDHYREGCDSAGDTDELQKRFKDVVRDVQTMLRKIESWRRWFLCDHESVKNWSKGRLTLLGDATHPTLQYLAQGAYMPIADAVVRGQLTARLYGEFFHAAGASREIRNQFLRGRTAEEARESMGWLYDGI